MAYQRALAHVIACSEAGLLPERLNQEGMERALVVLQQNLGASGRTKQVRARAEPATAAARQPDSATTVTGKRPALAKYPRCVALAEALKPVLEATCPAGAGGYGGALQANLHPADVEMLGGTALIRAAMRRAAGQLGWRVRTVGYAGEHLVVVIVQDVREAPAEVSYVLEKDFARRGQEMIERMSAHGNEEALRKLGPAPVERQTQAFLQAVQGAMGANPGAWR
ncbi:hypothetical protein [Streptomyces griseosporeus]|uniref:hypothetical protein n=1 Tax=Streptomyces griseosporeus TaxID=1910 RepID=UPI0036B9F97E